MLIYNFFLKNNVFSFLKNSPKWKFCEFLVLHFKPIQEIFVVELWPKNLLVNYNKGFFYLWYLANELRYDIEFLHIIRYP